MSIQLIYTDITGFCPDEKTMGMLTGAIPYYFANKVSASKNDTLKLQRLASGLLFMYAFKKMGYEAGEIEITEGDHGKPVLINPEGLYFNISHSEDLVMLAVSNTEVGCDIQKIRSGEKLGEFIFTPEEKAALNEAGEDGKDLLFTRLWARKESYIKATGEGMRRDLRSFSVLDDVTFDGHVLAGCDLGDYCVAVCVRCEDKEQGINFGEGDICVIPFQTLADVVLSY